jgi:hypothetical protein
MAQATLNPPPKQRPARKQNWMEKISRSGYFFGALLLHFVVFVMVATWVIFPAIHPPTEDFTKTYIPASAPPPPPPPPTEETVQVPTHAAPLPTTAIAAPTAAPSFNIPLPDLSPTTTATPVNQTMTQPVVSKTNDISQERLAKIMETEKAWGRGKQDILESNSDPKNITAKFPVYLASYSAGSWDCNVHLTNGQIDAGSLPDLVDKMNQWSHGHITGQVMPTPLNIGGSDLLDKKPPFIFFTGKRDFILTDAEIQNLRDYLQIGGAIWGDNTLAGRGSRFDVAFRREMKRVVPDLDKNFEPVDPDDKDLGEKIFSHGWFPMTTVPKGMNYYAEPIEHLDIDGKLAILYTPNDYGDLFYMHILAGDTQMGGIEPNIKTQDPLFTSGTFLRNKNIFFRNFELPSCLAAQQFGMNIIGYMLVRFDKDLLLSP